MSESQNPYEPTTEIAPQQPAVLSQEQQKLRENATNIFASGLVGLMAPLLFIYSGIFLLRNRKPFPRRRLAIIGTCLHGVWTPVWIYWILF